MVKYYPRLDEQQLLGFGQVVVLLADYVPWKLLNYLLLSEVIVVYVSSNAYEETLVVRRGHNWLGYLFRNVQVTSVLNSRMSRRVETLQHVFAPDKF